MHLNKYISLNLLSSLTYISLFLIVYVFFFENYVTRYYPNIHITIEQCGEIYIILVILSLIFIILFGIEVFIRKKFKKLLPIINFQNKFLKNLHETLFIIGSWFTIFNLILFIAVVVSISI